MGALPRPTLPNGPVRVLFDDLHELHHQAGWPSLRVIAREVGCSHTTVSVAFSGPRVPRWGLLELIVEMLGGDTGHFHRLWLEASAAPHEPAAPTIAVPTTAPAVVPTPAITPAPHDLPADVAGFTGRTDQLERLDRLLAISEHATAVSIAVVSGTAGVGKTALAVHWAHRAADRFPDGQLYANLRGYDIDEPVRPDDVLATFLRELGVDGAAVPLDRAERAARYRTLLAGRRTLILLDNAYSVDQVRDLLPGSSSCFVVITSRDALPALVARHGAIRIELGLLEAAEADELLRTLIGDRAAVEPDQARALAERCARLPLALRLAAERASSRPSTPLAALVSELADEGRRLDLLAAGDDSATAVRAVFSWSTEHASQRAVDTFGLLGLNPASEFDEYVTAALIGAEVTDARRDLDELCRAHLVNQIGPGGFGMHDLLRVYAAERADALPTDVRESTRRRLYDYYLCAASVAVPAAFLDSAPDPDPTGPKPPPLTSPAEARAWLDAERANLLAITRAAADAADGSPAHVERLTATLARYLNGRAHYGDAIELHQLAVATARREGDQPAEAAALERLAVASAGVGKYREALDLHRAAAELHRALDDRTGEIVALHGLGGVSWRLGRYAEAREHFDRELRLCKEIGDRTGEGNALYGLGVVHRRLGRFREALEFCQRAVTVHRAAGNRTGEGRAMNNLGINHLRMGQYAEALAHYLRTVELERSIGDQVGEATALTNLGAALEGLGRYDDALSHHARAYDAFLHLGYRVGQGDALRGRGCAHSRLGHHDQAYEDLRAALEIAGEIGEVDLETCALNDLGTALRLAGQVDEAVRPHEQALAHAEKTGDRYEQARALDGLGATDRATALYAELGVPRPWPHDSATSTKPFG